MGLVTLQCLMHSVNIMHVLYVVEIRHFIGSELSEMLLLNTTHGVLNENHPNIVPGNRETRLKTCITGKRPPADVCR